MAFDPDAYAAAVRDLNSRGYTGLVRGDALFCLAEAHKLSNEPPIPLDPNEISGGLHGPMYVKPRDLDELERRLSVVLPSAELIDAKTADSESEVLAHIVAAGTQLRTRLQPAIRQRLIALLYRWLKELGTVEDDERSIAEWELDASNPFVASCDHAARLIRELR